MWSFWTGPNLDIFDYMGLVPFSYIIHQETEKETTTSKQFRVQFKLMKEKSATTSKTLDYKRFIFILFGYSAKIQESQDKDDDDNKNHWSSKYLISIFRGHSTIEIVSVIRFKLDI